MAYGYGTNSPFGLKPSRNWDGTTNAYPIKSGYASNLFKGDPVVRYSDGTIRIGATGTGIIGVFWGCKYTLSSGVVHSDYWPTGTVTQNAADATAYIIDDPAVLFDIQISTSANSLTPTMTEAGLGYNYSFAITNGGAGNPVTGSTVTGQSGYYLDISSADNTATRSLKPVQLTPFINNAYGIYFNNVLVEINNHVYKGGTGTVGTGA